MSDLDGKITAMASAPGKPAAETTAALAAQSARLGKIDEALSSLDKRFAALETKLAAPKAEVRAPQAPDVANTREIDSAAARTVVAQSLMTAVQVGSPFATQLAALRSLGSDESSLKGLATSADKGVPTLSQLRDSLAALRPKLASKTPVADANASWSDRVSSRLASLVTIRSAGERAGPSPDAIASRADAALAKGDIAGALGEMRALPATEAAGAKDWLDAASRRVDAEADARALVAASIGALAKPRS